ncbi:MULTISPECIES: NAD(+) kinase [Ectothiorhodospira]|jgi:NAD+ kinase|nr:MULTISPECIES: NAD(+) kinase [Ectothiorhodospira]MCG5514856.1 NAD(+) kinase [Ectothiorhodospira sp. 9100]MCG5517590.1 NAD(+) kinase [Ectothiorhodospira sp. 9905]
MNQHFQTIGIIAKTGDQPLADILDALVSHLRHHQRHILLDSSAIPWLSDTVGCETASREQIAARADLAIIAGGDGTFLAAARTLVDTGVPLLGINAGRLGFLVDVSPHEMLGRLDEILSGLYVEDDRHMLTARVMRGDQVVAEGDALNDVVMHIRDVVRMIEFDTWINGRFVNTQRADGMVVATPTGSTAYALSGGGPILSPCLEAVVLVPICPHGLSNRPLVVPAGARIEIAVNEHSRTRAQAALDGQDTIDMEPLDRIIIESKPRKLHLIHPTGYDYLQILRVKLGWGEQP